MKTLANWLNKECRCIGLDRDLLRDQLASTIYDNTLYQWIETNRPNLFSTTMVFIDREQVQVMRDTISAIERMAANTRYRERVLSWAPPVACRDPKLTGVFFGYDFHLGADGPKIIEINTNAGGAMLCSVLAQAQRGCCVDVETLNSTPMALANVESSFVSMFQQEWLLSGIQRPLTTIAIVDDDPENQFLYPEFLLFQRLFESRGLRAIIAPPSDLELKGDGLYHGEHRLDMVYNRLTDFYLHAATTKVLRDAYEGKFVALTPNPFSYALYADKRNMAVLTDADKLRRFDCSEQDIKLLINGIAPTERVTPENITHLWENRKQYFFKPATGYGSKAVYRGDKITKRVWSEISTSDYVAQRLVPPSEREVFVDNATTPLKYDVRCYTYQGEIQLMAARLYQGQTTNFRTRGGGFAPIYFLPV